MTVTCEFCREPITDARQSYRKVTGWEQQRSAGGTNAVRLREPGSEWACRWCIDKQAKGHNAGQKGMF